MQFGVRRAPNPAVFGIRETALSIPKRRQAVALQSDVGPSHSKTPRRRTAGRFSFSSYISSFAFSRLMVHHSSFIIHHSSFIGSCHSALSRLFWVVSSFTPIRHHPIVRPAGTQALHYSNIQSFHLAPPRDVRDCRVSVAILEFRANSIPGFDGAA